MFSSEDQTKPRVLAIVPAYNESERVEAVIKGVLEYLPVLVVDDGSTDQTSFVAKEAGAEVLRQEPNQGKGAALLRGFAYALDQGYDAVITLDADGQHAVDEIPLFLTDYYTRGSDLIIGKRDFKKMPFPRRYTNQIGTWSFSNAMGQYIPDNQSGYRLHSRRLMEAAIQSQERGFEFEVEIILTCVLKGFILSWVPIKTIYNKKQNSKITPLRHVWRFYRLVWRTRQIMQDHLRSLKGNR